MAFGQLGRLLNLAFGQMLFFANGDVHHRLGQRPRTSISRDVVWPTAIFKCGLWPLANWSVRQSSLINPRRIVHRIRCHNDSGSPDTRPGKFCGGGVLPAMRYTLPRFLDVWD
jgi:hypothetical protein